MKDITILGIDLAKRNFHIVGLNAEGEMILRKGLKREDLLAFCVEKIPSSALVAMEACSGCNYWGQQFQKAGFTVRLLKPKDVKSYVGTRQKNDLNDALAIAKAAKDKTLREVYVRNRDEQDIALLHKLRANTQSTRIQKTNGLMSSLLEFGFDGGLSKTRFLNQMENLVDQALQEGYITPFAYELLQPSLKEIRTLLAEEDRIDKLIKETNKTSSKAQVIQTIPGLGDVVSSNLSVLPIETYGEAKDFSASLGLVPSQHTTGGKIVLGGITKRGNRQARTLLIQGARCLIMSASKMKEIKTPLMVWAYALYKRLGFNKASVAIANKLARIAHACVTQNVPYDASKMRFIEA
jgi:transposase